LRCVDLNGTRGDGSEVEHVLRSMREILDAPVICVPDEARGEEVLALLVPAAGQIDPETVPDYCATNPARLKVPRSLRIEPGLPKTPSGKIAKGPQRER
jgi:acyl-CoA synthetase (AMP-forming)/AMP-acid ligase II